MKNGLKCVMADAVPAAMVAVGLHEAARAETIQWVNVQTSEPRVQPQAVTVQEPAVWPPQPPAPIRVDIQIQEIAGQRG